MPSGRFARSELAAQARTLRPSDAVAGLLVLDDGRYIMQLRDAIPGIFFPGCWGCFGGAIERGEQPLDALKRELREELEFHITDARRFTRFDFDFAPLDHPTVYRVYFEVPVSEREFQGFVLHEGADCQALSGEDLLSSRRLTPYDAFAVWMHMSRPA